MAAQITNIIVHITSITNARQCTRSEVHVMLGVSSFHRYTEYCICASGLFEDTWSNSYRII